MVSRGNSVRNYCILEIIIIIIIIAITCVYQNASRVISDALHLHEKLYKKRKNGFSLHIRHSLSFFSSILVLERFLLMTLNNDPNPLTAYIDIGPNPSTAYIDFDPNASMQYHSDEILHRKYFLYIHFKQCY